MQVKRAIDIFKSSEKVEVHYGDDPVWIKKVDQNSGIAQVEILENHKQLDVPVTKLREIH